MFIQRLSFPDRRASGKAVANATRATGKPASKEQRRAGQKNPQEHRIPGMPLPAKVRFVRDEGQKGGQRASLEDETIFPANAPGDDDHRKAPDQDPGDPVERPHEWRGELTPMGPSKEG